LASGASRQKSKNAFREAEKSFSTFQEDWIDRINRLPTGQLFETDIPTPTVGRETSSRIAFIGHPYNLYDIDINKDLLALAKHLEMEILTSDLLSETLYSLVVMGITLFKMS
jgi:predicted nucleotide-binding protein (sugar kinase/HSP70/actin superfamily)